MKEELKTLVREYLDNKALAEQVFVWQSAYLPPVCASILLKAGRSFTKEELENARNLIKDNTGIFSDYRGTAMTVMACVLAAESNPESAMNKSLEVYNELRKHFSASEYLPFVSMIIGRLSKHYEYIPVCQRAKAIYDDMKQNHPFLTSKDDVSNAALLAYSTKADAEIGTELENCYNELKKYFSSSNDVQALSQVLTIGEGSWQDNCARFMRIFKGLGDKGYKYGKDSRLPILGALSVISVPEEEVIQDVIDICEALKGQKGYGFFGFTKSDRLMHAVMLLSTYYAKQKNELFVQSTAMTEAVDAAATVAELNSIIAILAAQNAAMISTVMVVSASSNH